MSEVAEYQAKESRFRSSYMLAPEICETVGVTRGAISRAIERGKLPKPIYLTCNLCAWEREEITPYVQKWKETMEARRGDQ